MPVGLREAKIFAAQTKLASFGPHYLIDTVADLIPVIDSISERIARGEMPTPADFAVPVFPRGNLCLQEEATLK